MAVNDEIMNNLAQYGGGSINERVYNYLGSLGFTGSLSDRLSKFSSEGRNGWQGLLRAWGQWKPAQLFSQGQQGVWYESRPEYLYQDSAGTTPVTADGQPVGYMQDLSSNGNHAAQATASLKPAYTVAGGRNIVSSDGFDDYMTAALPLTDLTLSPAAVSVCSTFKGVGTYLISLSNGSTGSDWLGLRIASSGAYGIILRTSDGVIVSYDSTFAADTLAHVFTIEFDGAGVANFYIDGTFLSGLDISAGLSASLLSLFSLYRTQPEFFTDSDMYGGVFTIGNSSGIEKTQNYLANLAGV